MNICKFKYIIILICALIYNIIYINFNYILIYNIYIYWSSYYIYIYIYIHNCRRNRFGLLDLISAVLTSRMEKPTLYIYIYIYTYIYIYIYIYISIEKISNICYIHLHFVIRRRL